ncbi:MFS transporter [Alicyclobacillus ferrooxydans]|nr:MFS transporter [Alicyclobacillus ferrooxydans]
MSTRESAGGRLDRLPMTKRHYGVFSLLAGGGFFDGFDIYIAGSVLASMVATHFSTVGKNASFVSATFLGLLLGTLVVAAIADKVGRRFSARYALLLYGVATILCAVMPSFSGLLVMRFFAGLGLGGVIVTSYGLWVEFVPKRSRGFWAGAMSFVINLSQPISALLALILVPHYGWRSLFWVAGVPAVIMWVLQALYLPESPRWLESKGKQNEANKVIGQFEKYVTNKGASVQGTEDQPKSAAPVAALKQVNQSSLWGPGVRKATILAIIISVLTIVTWYTFTAWIPTFFVKSGLSEVKTFTFTFVIMLGAIPGNALAAILSDRLGRKNTLIVLSILLGVISLLYGYSRSPGLIMTFGFLFVMGGNILIAMTIASYIPEMFPTNVRMAGSSLANAFGRAATIASPYFIVFLYGKGGQNLVFWSSFVMYVVLAACILFLGRETKKKSLEEIAYEEISEVSHSVSHGIQS